VKRHGQINDCINTSQILWNYTEPQSHIQQRRKKAIRVSWLATNPRDLEAFLGLASLASLILGKRVIWGYGMLGGERCLHSFMITSVGTIKLSMYSRAVISSNKYYMRCQFKSETISAHLMHACKWTQRRASLWHR